MGRMMIWELTYMTTTTKLTRFGYYLQSLTLLLKYYSTFTQLSLEVTMKSRLEMLTEKFIVRVSKFLLSSHANILLVFFKDMSINEFVIDLFRDHRGNFRTVNEFCSLLIPSQLGVFYKVIRILNIGHALPLTFPRFVT